MPNGYDPAAVAAWSDRAGPLNARGMNSTSGLLGLDKLRIGYAGETGMVTPYYWCLVRRAGADHPPIRLTSRGEAGGSRRRKSCWHGEASPTRHRACGGHRAADRPTFDNLACGPHGCPAAHTAAGCHATDDRSLERPVAALPGGAVPQAIDQEGRAVLARTPTEPPLAPQF